MDLYISFQQKDGVWSNAFSLGKEINTQALEGSSFVTADGKYLFFSRKFDIFWVSAKIIEDLRPKGLRAKPRTTGRGSSRGSFPSTSRSEKMSRGKWRASRLPSFERSTATRKHR